MRYLTELYGYLIMFAEIFFAEAIFAFSLKKKEKFNIRIILSLSISLAAIFLIAGVNTLVRIRLVRDMCYIVVAVMAVVWIAICFKETIWDLIFYVILGNSLYFFTLTLSYLILTFAGLPTLKVDLINRLIRLAVFAVVYLIAYFTLGKNFKKKESINFGASIIALYAVIIAINALISYVAAFVSTHSKLYYIFLLACQLMYSMLVIAIDYLISGQLKKEINLRMLRQLVESQQKQFSQQKENMENINYKIHDLRHQLRNARQRGELSDDAEKEIMQAVSIYNSKVNSGNSALDVLLTEKNLICENKKIQFSCLAEGKRLAFINEFDIYSLFGNAIENAIEYLETVQDPDNRFIFFTLKEVKSFLLIEIENYFSGELEIKDGFPVTSKKDKTLHGFGIKSMRQIIDKYKGSMSVQTAHKLFRLKIVVPIPQAQNEEATAAN